LPNGPGRKTPERLPACRARQDPGYSVRAAPPSAVRPAAGWQAVVDLLAPGTGEPGFGALVTGKTSPHNACTNVPITALSAIFAFRT
jgi:hypothetical protein